VSLQRRAWRFGASLPLMKKKQFLVLGLGRFGTAVASTLHELGHEVVALDRDEERVRDVMDCVTHALVADASEERATRDLDVRHFDAVIVAIGSNVEANIFATLAAKEAGARRIICKASNDIARRVLERIGADRVIRPEHDSGMNLARELASPLLLGELVLTPELSLIELEVGPELVGKIGSLVWPGEYRVSLVAVVRGDSVRTFATLAPDSELLVGDKVVLIGRRAALERLRDRAGG
jgi:trk system potassium uptake protein TrkA